MNCETKAVKMLSLSCCLVAVLLSSAVAGLRFPLTMPHVLPQLPRNESYLCTGVAVDPDTELFITAFEPLASRLVFSISDIDVHLH